jgi:hypothetical protein
MGFAWPVPFGRLINMQGKEKQIARVMQSQTRRKRFQEWSASLFNPHSDDCGDNTSGAINSH